MAVRYVAGVGFVDGDKKLSTQSTYAAQQKREDELKRSQQAAQERAALQHRNEVRSTDAYQSARRSSYANRAETETADFQQSRRNLSDALDNYKRVGERLKAAREVVESGAFGEGTLQYNEAAETVAGLEREYKSALDRYTAANRDYNARIQRGPSSPFYIEEAGVYANAEEAQRAMNQGFTVRHTGSSNYGADMGGSDLVTVLDRLNQQNIEERRGAADRAIRDSATPLHINPDARDTFQGGLETDIEKAKESAYYANARKRASELESETAANDQSSNYRSPTLLFHSPFTNRGQSIASNAQNGMTENKAPVLTDTEKRTILSLAAQERWDDVETYYDSIQSRINERIYGAQSEAVSDMSKAGQVAYGIAASAATAPGAYLQALGASVKDAPVDINSGAAGTYRTARQAQQESLEDLPEWGQFLGNVGYSMAQNAAVLPLGPAGAAIWLGASAAGSSTIEAMESGATRDQAIARGTISGLIEIATEKLSLDNLFKTAKSAGKTGLKAAIGSVFKQAKEEGREELISEFANTIFDMVQMGEDSAYNQRFLELVNSGLTENEARTRVNAEFFFKNPALAAAAGAVSGALMGGGSTALQQRSSGKANRELATNSTALINTAMNLTHKDGTLKRESDAFQIADQIARDQRYGKKIDNNRYYDLAQALKAEGVSVENAVAAETERQQQAEAARAAQAAAEAEEARVRAAQRASYEQEGASIFRAVAEEENLTVSDSPAVNAAIADMVEDIMNSTNVNDPAVRSVMTRAATTIENAYLQALSAEYGGSATVTDDGMNSVRRELTGEPISISRTLEQSDPELYERALSALNVQDGAQSVSMAYSRLQDQTPDAYTADTEAEQLRQMVDIVQSEGQAVELSGLSESDRVVLEGLANDYATAVIERAMSYAASPDARQAAVSASDGNVSADGTNAAQNGSQPVRKANLYTSKHYSDSEIMRNVVESAAASGVHANVALSISNIAGETHVKTEFQNLGADSGVNGFYDKATGTIVINADVLTGEDYQAATKAAFIIYGHELVHHLESTGYYAQLKKVVLQSAEVKRQLAQWSEQIGKRATFTDLIRMQQRESAKSGQNISLEQAERDYIAQFVAENYIGNPQQLQKVARMDRSLAEQILDWMRRVLRNVNGVYPGKSELEQAQAVLALALDERYMQPDTGEGVQYSIEKTVDNKPFVEVENDILNGVPEEKWVSAVQENLKNKYPDGIRIKKELIRVDNQSRGEMTLSRYSQWLRKHREKVYADKLRATDNADEILQATTGWAGEEAKHDRKDQIVEFARGQVLLRIGGNDYSAEVVVGTERDGSAKLYDIVQILPTTIEKKGDHTGVGTFQQTGNPLPAATGANPSPRTTRTTNTVSDTSVSPNAASVNTPASVNFGVSSQAELLNRYLEEYGPMLRGERVQHMDGSGRESGTWQAPKQTSDSTYTRRTVQTFANTPSLSPADRRIAMEMVNDVGQYVRIGNPETVQQAREKRSQYSSFEQAVGVFLSEAKDARIKDARVLVALGQQLLMESANQQNNKQTTYDIMATLAELQTQLGQGVQAASIISKLSPEGQLVAVKRVSDKTAELVKKQAGKKQKRKNSLDAAAANDVADGADEAARGARKVADAIKRGASDDEINRMIDSIEEDLRRKVQLAESVGGDADSAAKTLRRLEELQKQREEELNKLADKTNKTKEEIKAARAKLNELNKELRTAKAQASGAVKRYEDVFAKLDAVKSDKSDGKYRKAVEAFDTAKQAAKDARTFAKYAEENYFAPPKQLMDQLINAKSESEREDIKHKIVLYMAEQMPGTAAEKVDAWRYFSMLANPKTHLRNVLGNAAMWGARKLRNTMASAIESVSIKDQNKRSRAITTRWGDSELYAAARKVFDDNQRDIAGNPKYSLPGEIQEQRRIFGGNVVSDKFETVRQWVGNALEKEDVWFLQPAFESSWAGFVKARGYNVNSMTEQQKAEAFEFAKNEAQVATFKEANAVSEALSRFRRTNAGTKFVADAIMPFTKTPMNILKTSIDYSPIGVVKSVVNGIHDAAVGEFTASEFITNLSAGLTGTGMALLGMWGAAAGWITGGEDDDPDRKNALDRAGGFQEYSLKLGNMYFSIDWAAPAVVPVMMGVELFNATRGNTTDQDTLSIAARVIETLGRAADPIFEMSMLEGIMSALDSYESGAQKVSDIAFSAVESYLGQFIPTLFGQLARSVDPVKRSTYSSKDAVLTKTIEQAGRRLIAKIPWASKYLKPVIDRTGKETAQVSTNGFVRVLAQFVSPGNLAFDQFTGVDDELLRLYDLFGETDVLPKSVPSSITNNKQTYNLSSEEYTQYSVILGSQTYTNLETLFASEEYKGMSDEDKKEAAAEIINEAQKEAKASFLDGRGVFNFVRQSTKAEKAEHIRVSSLSDAEKIAQFRSIMTDEQNKVLDELASTGNGWKEIDLLDCYAQYATIDKREDLTANEKRVELAKYITQSAQFNYLTAAQVDKFMNSFGYSSGFKADETSYEKFVKAGLSLKGAESMSNALLALADQEGNTTDAQKFAAISKANATNAEKWTALETLYAKDESLMIDFEAMQQAGASADTYVKTYTKFNEIEKEAKKHKDDDSYEGASYYMLKYLAESGMSAKEIGAIYKNMGGLTNADGIEKLKSLEDAGIGYDVIVQYKYKTALLTADKDKNGKTISGSKKDKVLRVINSLPITSAQKDALYLYADYSSKDIRKTPWH